MPAPKPSDRWPIAFLRRPITLPAGLRATAINVVAFQPDSTMNFDPVRQVPYVFHSRVQVGLSVSSGLTDQLQVSLSIPSIVCVARAEPYGCSRGFLYGVGVGFDEAVLRTPAVQIVTGASMSVLGIAPVEFQWSVGAAARWRLGSRVGGLLRINFARELPGSPVRLNPLMMSGSVGLYLQASEQLLLFAFAYPSVPVDDVTGGVKLGGSGGASFTFNHHVALSISATDYDFVANRRWDQRVPGRSAEVSLVTWFP